MAKLEFRYAERKDVSLILYFIKQLAEYEKMPDEVVATEELLEEWIFDKNKAEVIFVMDNDVEAGFALFFHNFSTFLGRAGIYLEDLFVLQEYRGKGYGKALLKKLAQIAVERGCGRLEWCCLDWNKPSIDFYRSLGAVPMEEWTTYRIAGETLYRLAEAEGLQTVGTRVNISHLRACRPGTELTATAEIVAVDGRKLTYKVAVSDSTGLIGEGEHERFVIDPERFMAKIK